jgi:hypothetical protein
MVWSKEKDVSIDILSRAANCRTWKPARMPSIGTGQSVGGYEREKDGDV